MKKINKTAARVMDQLTKGLDNVGDAHEIDNSRAYMSVHVDRIGEKLYSVAHYFIRNGDMMADPDVVFYNAGNGWWYPCQITMHATGYYRDFVEFDADGNPARYNRRGQADLATFCGTWMKNIKAQQDSFSPAPKAAEPVEAPVGAPAPSGPMSQLALF